MIGEQKLTEKDLVFDNQEKEIEIFGVKFKASIFRSPLLDGTTLEILTLKPIENWSMSRSTSSAKEINIFKRRK